MASELDRLLKARSIADVLQALEGAYLAVERPGCRSDRIDFDLALVERLGALQATVWEAARFFGVSRSTMTRRLAEPEYRMAWQRGRVAVKLALRRKQLEVALAGDNTMLIWLGKQMLGQANEPVQQLRLSDGWEEPTIDMDEFDLMMDELMAEFDGGPGMPDVSSSGVEV